MKTYKYKVQGVDYEVEIAEVEGKIAKVNVNGIPFEIEMQKPINAAKHPALAATKRTASAAPAAQPVQNNIEAETAGTVTSVLVNQGDTVMEGAVMLTIG